LLDAGRMKSLRASMVLLSIWAGLNFLIAFAVAAITLSGATTPILSLVLDDTELRTLSPHARAIIEAQAAIANPCICALCVAITAIVWTSLRARARWALWTLIGMLVPLQACAFASDAYLGNRNLIQNLISAALLAAGLGLAALAVRAPLTRRRVAV
jgi:hypothetical protein